MVLKMFIVRDGKGDMYNNPRFLNTHAEAEREFSMLANDKKTMVGMFPEDFDLYYVGEFDNQTGKFEIMETPKHLHKAIAFVKGSRFEDPKGPEIV